MIETIRMGALELRFLQTKQGTDASLDMFEMRLQPNARMPIPHYHEDWDETIYGLAGTSAWRIGGEAIELRPGESAFIRRGVVHSFDNRSDGPATCLCVLTPGTLDPAYFSEMAALLGRDPPDREAMRATMIRHRLIPAP